MTATLGYVAASSRSPRVGAAPFLGGFLAHFGGVSGRFPRRRQIANPGPAGLRH